MHLPHLNQPVTRYQPAVSGTKRRRGKETRSVQLEDAELEVVNSGKAIVTQRLQELHLLQQGLNTVWWQLRKKYGFSEDITFDPESGIVDWEE